MLAVDRMIGRRGKAPLDAAKAPFIRDCEAAVVEQDVVVRAQTQDVVQRIRPMMGRSQRTDVGGLCIPPALALQACPANLTSKLMEVLYMPAQGGVAHD